MLSWLDRFSTCKCEMWRRMVTRSQCSWPLCLDSIPRVPHVQQDSHLWLWWLWEYRWGGASPPCSTTWSFKALWTPGIAIRAASLASPKCELASAIQYIKTCRSRRWCIFWWILCYSAWVVYIYIYIYISMPCFSVHNKNSMVMWKMRHFGSVLEVPEAI